MHSTGKRRLSDRVSHLAPAYPESSEDRIQKWAGQVSEERRGHRELVQNEQGALANNLRNPVQRVPSRKHTRKSL